MEKITNKLIREEFNLYTTYSPPEWLIKIIRKIVIKFIIEVLEILWERSSPINKDIFTEINKIKNDL